MDHMNKRPAKGQIHCPLERTAGGLTAELRRRWGGLASPGHTKSGRTAWCPREMQTHLQLCQEKCYPSVFMACYTRLCSHKEPSHSCAIKRGTGMLMEAELIVWLHVPLSSF